MKLSSVAKAGRERMRRLHEKQKEKIRDDLARFGGEIMQSDEMLQAYRQTHHTRSTVGEHTWRVAEKSLAMGSNHSPGS